MTLSDRLQSLLDRRGLTMYSAAQLAGMPQQQVWRIVSGKVKNPGVLTVQRLVEAVGGTMAELFAE